MVTWNIYRLNRKFSNFNLQVIEGKEERKSDTLNLSFLQGLHAGVRAEGPSLHLRIQR